MNNNKKTKKWLLAIFTIITYFGLSGGLFAQDVYVKQGGTGDGSSWDSPLGDIKKAMTPMPINVYIAEGYYPFEYGYTGAMPLSFIFNMQGGFPSTATGTDLSGYAPNKYITTIDGLGAPSNIGMFNFNTGGGTGKTITFKGLVLKRPGFVPGYVNGSNVFNISSLTTNSTYNFIDLEFSSWGASAPAGHGIAFNSLPDGCIVNITNVKFLNINEGYAISIIASSANNTSIVNLTNVINAGSNITISITGVADINVNDLQICDVRAAREPMKFNAKNIRISNLKIQNSSNGINSTNSTSGFIGNITYSNSLKINNSSFVGNYTNSYYGLLNITAIGASTATIKKNLFANNSSHPLATGTASYPGATVVLNGGTTTVDSCVFYKNIVKLNSPFDVAAIYISDGNCVLKNTIFNGNDYILGILGDDIRASTTVTTALFTSITNCKMQLPQATYLPATAYVFGTGNTFSNTTDDGGAPALVAALPPCPNSSGFVSGGGAVPSNTAVGIIDCAKTQLSPAPVVGAASQIDLIVSINVSQSGYFAPITVSGSGMSVANGATSVKTTTTGVQTFHIPLKYDGTALGTLNFTVGSAGSCNANLATAGAIKQVVKDVWSLDNCSATMASPGIK